MGSQWQSHALSGYDVVQRRNGSLATHAISKSWYHQERIPWISHHPVDVKRGTFIGEMSRLATLCSLHSHYMDALKSLVALYCKRGYPENLVIAWLKSNIRELWEKRLSVNQSAKAPEGVLVLKSEFNLAWNYFSATELGNTILSYWREWLIRAERGDYTAINLPRPFPRPDGFFDEDLSTAVEPTGFADGKGLGSKIPVPDLRKIGMTSKQFIVSRKRTHNLYDLVNLWKKIVTERAEEMVVEEQRPDAPSHPYALVDPSTLYDPDSPSEENPETNYGLYTVRRQRSSPDRWGASR